MTTHPYYRTLARKALTHAGAPKANPTALAQWAEEHADQPKTGIVVNEDGEIVAQSVTQGRDVKVRYVDKIMDPTINPKGIIDTELGLAMSGIRRETGRPVIHLAQWEVCRGHVTDQDKARNLLADLTARIDECQQALDEAVRSRDEQIRSLSEGGMSQRQIAAASGLSQQRIGQILKGE